MYTVFVFTTVLIKIQHKHKFFLPDKSTCFIILISVILVGIALNLQQELILPMNCFTIYDKVYAILYCLVFKG